MQVLVWSDYICPWAYLGTARYRVIEGLGWTVDVRPFELHPEYPPGGFAVGEARRAKFGARFAAMLVEAGLPFVPPSHVPNTRLALEFVEGVRMVSPQAVRPLHEALFAAHFADGIDLENIDALNVNGERVGADVERAWAAVHDGHAAAALQRDREAALERGVTGTPAWWVADRLLLPGAQPPDVFERVLTRLAAY